MRSWYSHRGYEVIGQNPRRSGHQVRAGLAAGLDFGERGKDVAVDGRQGGGEGGQFGMV